MLRVLETQCWVTTHEDRPVRTAGRRAPQQQNTDDENCLDTALERPTSVDCELRWITFYVVSDAFLSDKVAEVEQLRDRVG